MPRLLAKPPPVFNPMDWACRSISVISVWNSLFNTLRSPVKVREEDCEARVFKRSRIWDMLLMPPSMIWSGEFRPFVQLAFHGHRAVHLLNDVLDDRKAQTRAAHLA